MKFNPLYVLAMLVLATIAGCMQPGYYAQHPITMPPAYAPGPNQQVAQQPLGAPFGSTVMSPYGVAIPRLRPVPNAFANASPQAAAWRAQGEAVAQSDYAVVAADAPQAPGSTQQGGNVQNGQTTTGGSASNDIQVLAGQQVQLNQRVRVMERMHGINPNPTH